MIYCGLDLDKACKEGYVLAAYRSGVELGNWNGNSFPWGKIHAEDDLLEIHIFNSDSEYRAVRSVRENNGFIESLTELDEVKGNKHKLKITKFDEKTENLSDMEYYWLDNSMLLLGETFRNNGDYYTAVESGTEKNIYLKDVNPQKGIYLKVIDYYDFDDNNLMYLAGYRMAGITVENGGDRDGTR